MAGLPWYVIWTEFSRHPKTRDLCARVKDRNAGMYVVRLLEHCAEHALDGRIPAHVIEEAADWRGKPGVLLAALEAAKWLEMDGEVRIVHGWVERNGARIRTWMDDNRKPHGARRKPRANPDEPPSGAAPGFAREDVDVEGKKPGTALPLPPAREAGAELPGDGGGNRTVAKDDAARANAATPEGSAPAAQDGGSEPGGVIAGATSPAGPAHPVDEDCGLTPAKPAGLGPLRLTPTDERRPDGTYPSTGRLSPLPRLSEILDGRYPLTAEVFRLCEAGGWRLGHAKDDVGRVAVENAIRLHGVEVAAERLLAFARGERAEGREPPPYIGWRLDTIQGLAPGELARQARGGAKPKSTTRVTEAASKATDFQGGRRL
jgi:hypothetical protein